MGLEEKSNAASKKEIVAVIGLGYVGLPLALSFVKKGFEVIGIDLDQQKIKQLQQGLSYFPDIHDSVVRSAVTSQRLIVTDNYNGLKSAETIILCIPTPLTPYDTPDLSCLTQAAQEMSRRIMTGQLIILESSTYPGTTKEVLLPILEKSGLKVGKDIYLGYSPERIDPGNSQYSIEEINKVVSGVTETCSRKVYDLYSQVFSQVITVSSTEAAELTKLVENSYRFINISFVNELAIICDSLNINVWEIIDAASTKPFGFSAFYPGPGIGGHCIPVDPLYLNWKIKKYGLDSYFIDISNKINHKIPKYIVEQIKYRLAPHRPIKHSDILLYGVAYKQNVGDVRGSSALEIMKLLQYEGANVSYHDPFVPYVQIDELKLSSVELTDELLQKSDCIVIITDHANIPLQRILEHASLVFDTRNATKGMEGKASVYRLGGGQ
ncbi:UDP-N-acetyl-D-glucosamine dehydrogenase [Brevibacillus choshinensis]|uniref:UDP-N-acetyl-D-glucosamine dehydrogenase n=1 Tax=Brevibacillus choshinensis TaxID=54911 RepID=A0ABR5N8B0_BRECH|nr:nucleotide sugar dehydrogenase [Brevibacillus choshinensis]KQL46858.1 UDP-N-acetyl-D-glucosamine dehydrogenase [Brevibacillus choshinensis]